MAADLEKRMVIGVSSRALFDLSIENEIFEQQGVEAYCNYQIEHELETLKPGKGFQLIKALLDLNRYALGQELVEVVIMSRNSPDTSLRVFNSIKHYGLPISRAVLVSGASLAPYLNAFHTDLFLSAYEDDVQIAIDSGIAAGIICLDGRRAGDGKLISFKGTEQSTAMEQSGGGAQIRIAFDGDAVLFSDESERIFKEQGFDAYEENECRNAHKPLAEGPFAGFLKKLSLLQKKLNSNKIGMEVPIRIALVTARSAPAHERVIRTLRDWDVRIDEAFFLGGLDKKEVLQAFGAQIFFDDQWGNTLRASQAVPAARVPYRKASGMHERARGYAQLSSKGEQGMHGAHGTS